MEYRLVTTLDAAKTAAIDGLCLAAPNAHFTQHPGWAPVGASRPTRTVFLLGEQAGRLRFSALVRLRATPTSWLPLADVFRGPMADSPEALLEGVSALPSLLRPLGPIAVRVDPYWSGPGSENVLEGMARLGFARMSTPPWSRRSLELPIDLDPEDLLQSFKAATRRQLRKALRLQIVVRDDLDDDGLEAFQGLYKEMVEVKGATPRPALFFRGVRDFCRVWPSRGFFLSSWLAGELLGGIVVFTLGPRAVYGFGASSRKLPEVPKSHLLHYMAMQRARAAGCVRYDFGGFGAGKGDTDSRTATQKINFFKSGFGGEEVDFVPAGERALRPVTWGSLKGAATLWRRVRAMVSPSGWRRRFSGLVHGWTAAHAFISCFEAEFAGQLQCFVHAQSYCAAAI